MKVHNKIGSKERLFEMFENVNDVKLNKTSSDLAIDEIVKIVQIGDQSPENKLEMIEHVLNNMYDHLF